MSAAPGMHAELASAWGLSDQTVVHSAGARINAVHWRHTASELDDAAMPVNALVYMLRPGTSTLHRGGRRIDAPATVGGMGLLPTGSHGRWTFEHPHESFHVYLPDELLTTLSRESELGSYSTLEERLRLEDPLLARLSLESWRAMREGPYSRLYIDTLGTAIGMRLIHHHSNLAGSRLLARGFARGGL